MKMLINGTEYDICPGANLEGTDLRDADLRGANLSGADLWRADLRDANIWEAKVSKTTRMPWTGNVVMVED